MIFYFQGLDYVVKKKNKLKRGPKSIQNKNQLIGNENSGMKNENFQLIYFINIKRFSCIVIDFWILDPCSDLRPKKKPRIYSGMIFYFFTILFN